MKKKIGQSLTISGETESFRFSSLMEMLTTAREREKEKLENHRLGDVFFLSSVFVYMVNVAQMFLIKEKFNKPSE